MVFEREDKMHEHRATHERAGDGGMIRPFHCSVPGCGKAFTEKRNLNVHRRTKHTEVRAWLAAGVGGRLVVQQSNKEGQLC